MCVNGQRIKKGSSWEDESSSQAGVMKQCVFDNNYIFSLALHTRIIELIVPASRFWAQRTQR